MGDGSTACRRSFNSAMNFHFALSVYALSSWYLMLDATEKYSKSICGVCLQHGFHGICRLVLEGLLGGHGGVLQL